MRRSIGMVALVAMFACGGGSGTNDSDTQPGTTTDDTGDSSMTSPSSSSDGTSTSGTGDTGDDCGFVCMPDGGDGSIECDPKRQDCPAGQKCTAWANDGGNKWNANKCVDVMGDGVAGDACMIEGGPLSGLDDCGVGFLCLFTDMEGIGVCVGFCSGTDEDCGTGEVCVTGNDGVLPICLLGCDPFLQDCPAGHGCYDSPDQIFVCFQDSSGAAGVYGDPCTEENSCDPGFWCGAGVSGCPAQKCCTPWCDLSNPQGCMMPDDCVSYFGDPQNAPPGFQDVGVCILP